MYITYDCYFEFNGTKTVVKSNRGISTFKDGFWVTDLLQLSQKSLDNIYWIPPSRILHITKVNEH